MGILGRRHGQAIGRAARARLGARASAGAAMALAVGLAVGPIGSAAASTRTSPAHLAGGHVPHLAPLRAVAPQPAADSLAHGVVPPRTQKPHGAAAKVFTVTTLADSPLASASLKTCTDLASGQCSLRAAIMAANNLGSAVEIKLGSHTYTLTDNSDGALLDTNPGGTTIVGVATHGTIISGPGAFTNSVFVVIDNSKGDSASLTLENLTVSGGTGTDGGAIQVEDYNAALVLDGVNVTHGAATYGGGIYCDDASMWLTNSFVSGNTAVDEGGGIYSYWCNAYLTRTNVNADTVTTGTKTMYGGGLYGEYGGVHLLDCMVSNDSVGSLTVPGEGGGLMGYYATFTLVGTTVSRDTANDDGEGGGADLYYGGLIATGSTFSNDRALGSTAIGGGIDLNYASYLELHNSKVEQNSTTSTSEYDAGGGIYVYGYEDPTTLLIDANSVISGNKTGAINLYDYYGGSDLEISNSTIQGNTNSLAGSAGINVYNEYGGTTIKLSNVKMLSNTDAGQYSAGAMYLYAYYGGITATVTNSLFKGNVGSGKYSSGAIQMYPTYGGTTLDMTGSQVLDNRAPDLGYGGGIGTYSDYSQSQLNLSHDTIEGNVAGSANAALAGEGGGIYAYDYGFVNLLDSTVAHNSALGAGATSGLGGGIYNQSYLGGTYTGDTITANKATGPASQGGGIYDDPWYGASRLIQSTVSDNTAISGAGLYLYYYSFEVDSSTIMDNVAGLPGAQGQGGGLYSYEAQVRVLNSTITGNRAVTGAGHVGEGGGIYSYDGNVDNYFTTIVGNVAPSGAAYYGTDSGSGSLRDSIVALNHPALSAKGDDDCHATAKADYLVSLGGNVLAQANCLDKATPSDVVTAKPMLAPLAANGGPTMTMALMTKSPAINAAPGDCLATDQRGVARPTSGHCDSGAFQLATKHKA